MTTSFKVPTLLTQISRNFHLKRKANPRKHVGAKYKNKSHRATMKRFKVTGTGRIMRWRAGKRHLARNKSKRQLRGLSKRVDVPKQLYKRYKQSMLF
jgi:large subunit ribosomal protein L35